MNAVTRTMGRLAVVAAVAMALVGTSAAGAGAAPENDPEVAANECHDVGGQWIEMLDENGNVTSYACALPDGTIGNCSPDFVVCWTERTEPTAPTTPIKDVPGIGRIGDDLGRSPDSPKTVSGVDSATPSGGGQSVAAPDDNQDQDTGKTSKKAKKGKGRRK